MPPYYRHPQAVPPGATTDNAKESTAPAAAAAAANTTHSNHGSTLPAPHADHEPLSPDAPTAMQTIMDLDAERLKSSAEQELTLSEVDPIKTDFYWFVLSVKDKLRLEAEQEVKAALAKQPLAENNNNVMAETYLINTNLNSRLMRAWEDLSSTLRDDFAKKEEEDRRRFQEEDEVASRHCATLTSRTKSPLSSSTAAKKESPDDEAGKKKKTAAAASSDTVTVKREPDDLSADDVSPTKKNRVASGEDEEDDQEEGDDDENVDE